MIAVEQSREKRQPTGEHGSHGKTDKHAKAAHARRGNGVHVSGTHLANRTDFDGDVANQRSHQPGDATGDGGNQ